MDDRDKGVYTPGTKPGCFLINNVNGWGPTLGAGPKGHLSPAEENVPSGLSLFIASVVPGMPTSISFDPLGSAVSLGHPDNSPNVRPNSRKLNRK